MATHPCLSPTDAPHWEFLAQTEQCFKGHQPESNGPVDDARPTAARGSRNRLQRIWDVEERCHCERDATTYGPLLMCGVNAHSSGLLLACAFLSQNVCKEFCWIYPVSRIMRTGIHAARFRQVVAEIATGGFAYHPRLLQLHLCLSCGLYFGGRPVHLELMEVDV